MDDYFKEEKLKISSNYFHFFLFSKDCDFVSLVEAVILSNDLVFLGLNPFLQVLMNFFTYFVPLDEGSLTII